MWFADTNGGIGRIGVDLKGFNECTGQEITAPNDLAVSAADGRVWYSGAGLGSVRADDTCQSYQLFAADGGVFGFGQARFYGSRAQSADGQPIIGAAPSVRNQGYWVVTAGGDVTGFGEARVFRASPLALTHPVVAITPTRTANGYWLIASDGGVFAYGDAAFLGSTGGTALNKPIVTGGATPSGRGYWLIASDGGVFAGACARCAGVGIVLRRSAFFPAEQKEAEHRSAQLLSGLPEMIDIPLMMRPSPSLTTDTLHPVSTCGPLGSQQVVVGISWRSFVMTSHAGSPLTGWLPIRVWFGGGPTIAMLPVNSPNRMVMSAAGIPLLP
jgi:hypothetical protein